ncbi:hypothetical protein DMC47_15580 [Nostoc sp. 3335mG]|nr:hypothetical protein DMC47_15580 [Nostoc sp. 3335mG]
MLKSILTASALVIAVPAFAQSTEPADTAAPAQQQAPTAPAEQTAPADVATPAPGADAAATTQPVPPEPLAVEDAAAAPPEHSDGDHKKKRKPR